MNKNKIISIINDEIEMILEDISFYNNFESIGDKSIYQYNVWEKTKQNYDNILPFLEEKLEECRKDIELIENDDYRFPYNIRVGDIIEYDISVKYVKTGKTSKFIIEDEDELLNIMKYESIENYHNMKKL
ncbi:hypothetical protein M0Q50_01925 [bacterium]|jgi:hypothetical protein|nr:hypothetical protein [bacterium]